MTDNPDPGLPLDDDSGPPPEQSPEQSPAAAPQPRELPAKKPAAESMTCSACGAAMTPTGKVEPPFLYFRCECGRIRQKLHPQASKMGEKLRRRRAHEAKHPPLDER